MHISISQDPVARAELALFLNEQRADIKELSGLLDKGDMQRATQMAEHIAHNGQLSGQVLVGLISQRLHNALCCGYANVIQPSLNDLEQYLNSLESELAL